MFSAAGPINQYNTSTFPPDPGTSVDAAAGIIGETDIIGYSPTQNAILCWHSFSSGILRKYSISTGTVTATIASNAGIPGGMDILREHPTTNNIWYATHSSGALEIIELDPSGSMSVANSYNTSPPNSTGSFTYILPTSSVSGVDATDGSIYRAGVPITADDAARFDLSDQSHTSIASGVGQSNTPAHMHWDTYNDRLLWFKGNTLRQYTGTWSTLGTTASSGDKAYGGMASTPSDGTYFTYGTDDGDSHIAHVSAGGTVTDNLYTTAADTMWLGCAYHPLWNKVFLLSQDDWDQASVTYTWYWFTPSGTSISVNTMTAGTQVNSDAFNNNQKITGLAIVPTRLEVWGLANSAAASTSKLLKLTP